jgi:phosphoribosylglycinamide formyltransferase 1
MAQGMNRRRVGVLISGRGSNLRALIAACTAPDFPAEIATVVSDRADATGLAHASGASIPQSVVERRDYAGKAAFEAEIDRRLRAANVDLVCLAGFMRVLSADFVAAWPDRILNIHPSLLPAFPGLDTHARVLEAGVRITGCTVHFVRAAVDSGPIVVQAAVPVLSGDTPETLAARVLVAEHRAYPLALRLVATEAARVTGDVVTINGLRSVADILLNPVDG